MCSFCLLASMELILIPTCSLLYLHSNDMKVPVGIVGEKVIDINIICFKKIKSVCNQLKGRTRSEPLKVVTIFLESSQFFSFISPCR